MELLGISLLILVLSIVYVSYQRTGRTVMVSGINLYRQPITVQFAGFTYIVQPFGIYETTVTAPYSMEIEVLDKDNQQLASRKYSTTGNKGVIMDIWSAGDIVKACAVEANLQNIFYPNAPELDFTRITTQTISDQGVSGLYKDIANQDYQQFLTVGSYSGAKLKTDVVAGTKVDGIFFVKCEDTTAENTTAIQDTIKSWLSFNPESQQQLFVSSLLDIDASTKY